MERLKVHIHLVMLWEFKQGNNVTETAEKICSVYSKGIIIDQAVQNWFMKFHSEDTSLKNNQDQGAHRTLMLKL